MAGSEPQREASVLRLDAPQSEGGPTALRIALGVQLRRLREQSGITREDAGYAIRGSHAKISRLELGRVSFKERDVTDLLTLYGVHDATERAALIELARQANRPGWWHRYSDVVPGWFETYLGLEQAASRIRAYEAQFVPGLLQTEDTARAIITLGHSGGHPDEMERRVQLRLQRQQILTRPQAPDLWAVLDEAALLRPVGGAQVLRQQLRHLIEIAELPNVTLQIARYQDGGHAAAGGPFAILRFAEPDLPDIVYLEQLTSALYLDRRQDVEHYLAVMERLAVQAAAPDKTVKILGELLRQQ